MSAELSGRRAVVTGAAQGIGRAVATRMVTAGASVALLDVDAAGLSAVTGELRDQGGTVQDYVVDLSDEAATVATFAAVLDAGRVDILVNQAGVIRRADLTQSSLTEWEAVQQINVSSMFLACRAVIPAMQDQGGGVIVNCASGTAFASGRRLAAYSASKGAVLALTRSLCVDYGPTIRANAVCPGLIDTPGAWLNLSVEQEAARRASAEATPLGRLGTAAEVAEAVLFLASPRSSYCSGTALMVDGGSLAQA